MTQEPTPFASATGHKFSGGDWLDVHFESSRPEYEAQLRAVGIQPGWHVLDAACGSGSFLPCMAELVGPNGHLAALDLAPDNVAHVELRLIGWQLPCPVEPRVGSVFELPYPDDAFDAVWFANTSQYLTDAELGTTLAEFRRVVRPGGVVAVKEGDVCMYRIFPAPPGVILRYFQARARPIEVDAFLRVPGLPQLLRRAGLLDVWQRTTLSERAAPLDVASRAFWRGALTYWAKSAAELELPAADQAFWELLRDPAALEHFLDDPDCCLVEGNLLTVGTVPSGDTTGVPSMGSAAHHI